MTISNDGATILQQLDVEHPAGKVLVELSNLQDQEARGAQRSEQHRICWALRPCSCTYLNSRARRKRRLAKKLGNDPGIARVRQSRCVGGLGALVGRGRCFGCEGFGSVVWDLRSVSRFVFHLQGSRHFAEVGDELVAENSDVGSLSGPGVL